MEFLPAIASAALTIGSNLLGFFKQGTAGGKDPQYVSDVNRARQEEYTVAQNALTQVTVPAAQQLIVNAYNQEQSLWGDPNNPSRNVAQPTAYKNTVADIVAKYSTVPAAGPAIPAAGDAIPAAGPVDVSGALNNFISSLNSALPLISNTGSQQNSTNYTPIIIVAGLVVVFFILKGR